MASKLFGSKLFHMLWGRLPLFNGKGKPCGGSCEYHQNAFGYVLMSSCHLQEGHTGPCCCGHRTCRHAREFEMANTEKLERLPHTRYEFRPMGRSTITVDEEFMAFVADNLGIVYKPKDFIIHKKSGKIMHHIEPDQKYLYISVD